MQKRTLFIMSTLSIIILGSCTAFFLQTDTNRTKNNPGVILAPDQSGIETDTSKRLTTYAHSGTNWGMSPFGSGKPLTEDATNTNSGIFKKPNTEWKTRTVTLNDGRTLTYVFGEGNPADADPLSEKEKEAYNNCNSAFEDTLLPLSCGSMGNEVFGYITPQVESDLKKLLEYPTWEKILTDCSNQFRQYNIPEWSYNYDTMLASNPLDIDNMFTVDINTGRKTLAYGNFYSLRALFIQTFNEGKELTGKEILNMNNCLSRNGGLEIYYLMDRIYTEQFYPFGVLPQRIAVRDKYIPFR